MRNLPFQLAVRVFALFGLVMPWVSQAGDTPKRGVPVAIPTLANPELLDKGDITDDAVKSASCSEAYNYQATAEQKALFNRVKRGIAKVQNGVNAVSWLGVPHTAIASASFNAYNEIAALGADGAARLQAIAEAGEEASTKYDEAVAKYEKDLTAWQRNKASWESNPTVHPGPFKDAKPTYPDFPLSAVYADLLNDVYHDLFDVDPERTKQKPSRFGIDGRKYNSKNGKYFVYMAFQRLIENSDLCGEHEKPTSIVRWKLVKKVSEFKKILARNVDEYVNEEVLKKDPVAAANAMIVTGVRVPAAANTPPSGVRPIQ
jgi:hypothetical protein